MSIIIAILIGLVAGWLAGQIVKGGGYGLIGDIVVGIVGSVIASWLFPRLGISLGGDIVGAIISATIGAIMLLVILRLIKRASTGMTEAPGRKRPGASSRQSVTTILPNCSFDSR